MFKLLAMSLFKVPNPPVKRLVLGDWNRTPYYAEEIIAHMSEIAFLPSKIDSSLVSLFPNPSLG